MRMGTNKNIDNIQIVSNAKGLEMVVENNDKTSSTHNVSRKHRTRAFKDDELSTVNDIGTKVF